jgi:hypothetical protein
MQAERVRAVESSHRNREFINLDYYTRFASLIIHVRARCLSCRFKCLRIPNV